MGRVSKRPLDKELEKEIEEQLLFTVVSLTDKERANSFLSEFLTSEEKKMLGKRLLLYVMLYKGLTNTEIYTILSMSHETIRWYKQVYEAKEEIFKKQIEILIKRERAKNLWNKVEALLRPFDLALQSKRNMKARAKLLHGDF